MESGLIAIIITLCIIVSAIKTRRCVECMLLGSLIAAFFTYGKIFLAEWCNVLQKVMAEEVWVFLVCLLFWALVEQLTASRGSLGFSKYLAKLCNSDKKIIPSNTPGILRKIKNASLQNWKFKKAWELQAFLRGADRI